MYATKRKLHNLLAAATGSGSSHHSGSSGSSGSHSNVPNNPPPASPKHSRLSAVFRSKSTVNLQAKAALQSSDTVDQDRPGTAKTIATLPMSPMSVEHPPHTPTEQFPSQPQTPTTPAPDPKKRRTGDPEPKVTAASPERYSIRHTSYNPSSDTPAPSTVSISEKLTPAYAPWDRPQFLSRLKTYRFVDKWSAKPTEMNEVVWAKRGWICVDKNRVQCTVCAREVVVRVDMDGSGDEMDVDEEDGENRVMAGMEKARRRRETQRKLVERYTAMVIDEHEDYCLWRRRGCDSDYPFPSSPPPPLPFSSRY